VKSKSTTKPSPKGKRGDRPATLQDYATIPIEPIVPEGVAAARNLCTRDAMRHPHFVTLRMATCVAEKDRKGINELCGNLAKHRLKAADSLTHKPSDLLEDSHLRFLEAAAAFRFLADFIDQMDIRLLAGAAAVVRQEEQATKRRMAV
jgi:hypothetical protein